MAINAATSVYGLRGFKFFAVQDVDVSHQDPNDPTMVSAQAQVVVIAGGNAGPTNPSVPNGANIAEGSTTDAAYTDTTGAAAGSIISLLKGWFRSAFAQASVRVASSAAAGNPAVAKAAAGALRAFWGQNGAAITYLQIYNKATAPVIGTDVPILSYPIPALAAFNQSIPGNGLQFAAGIAYAFTTDAAGTAGAAAAAVTSFNLFYN